MYYALQRPDLTIVSIEKDSDKSAVAGNVADHRISNVFFYEDYNQFSAQNGIEDKAIQTILLDPSDKDTNDYLPLNPIIIK